VPEADPVTDPPCDVDPLSVGGGLSVGPVWPLVVDDVLDVSDGLAVGDGDWLGEVVVWAGFLVGEEVGVAFAALVGVALGQPVAEAVGLAFALGDLVAVALVVGVTFTVAVAVTVGLTLGVIVGLSVGLAGGVVVVGLADGLLVVGVGDGLTFGVALGEVLGVGDGEHDVTGEEVESPAEVAVPLRLPPTDPPAGDCPEGCWLDEVAPLKADTTILPSPSRNGGTAASTTPTANTVTPMARAGRSMTSLQFLGRRGACRRWPAEPSCAKNPAIASRIAAILDWLA
jgi:hypothetical protein